MSISKKVTLLVAAASAATLGFVRAQDADAPTEADCVAAAAVAADAGASNFADALGMLATSDEQLVSDITDSDPLTAADTAITIFVPNNGALPEEVVETLTDSDALQPVIETHVVEGAYPLSEIEDGDTVTTFSGETLVFTVEDGTVTVAVEGGASFTTLDEALDSCAGPVYIVGDPLLPAALNPATEMPAEAPMEEPMEAPEMEEPAEVPEMEEMDEPMEAPGMAPSDAPGAPPMMEELPPMDAVPPVDTRELPAGPLGTLEECLSVVDKLEAEYPELYQAASATLDAETLAILSAPDSNLTVLVPPAEQLQALINALSTGARTADDIVAILGLHVIDEPLLAEEVAELDDGTEIDTLGGTIELTLDGGIGFISGNVTAMVLDADIDACGGESVIHVISETLLPEGVTLPVETGEDIQTPRGPPVQDDEGTAVGAVGAGLASAVVVAAALMML